MKKQIKKTDAVKKPCTGKCAVKKVVTKKVPAKKPTLKSVLFTVHAEKGKVVHLAGSFNDWSVDKTKMSDTKKNGIYSVSVKLAPGTYQYKFVIDGVWCSDPECADFVKNDMGTFNSVITVK